LLKKVIAMNNQTITLLEKHFDTAFAAPDGIKKLRELILTLAMQGKLVPQDPNDQPVSELLKAIEVEKQRLVKEGKIKQPKPLPEIKPEEVPYELPKGWIWMRLGSLAQSIDYGTSMKSNDDSSKVPVYRMGNIVDGQLLNSGFKYVNHEIDDLPRLYLWKNDILFNRTNSYELVGKTAIYLGRDDNATFASYLIRVRLAEKHLLPTYFSMMMNAPYFRRTQIEPEIVQQCGQANFNGSKLSATLIPLSPLAEQHRIVTKIDQLMARCDELEKLRAEREQKRITVHTAALNRLLMDTESNDFSTAWRFITQHFGELYSVKENVAELRKAILQLAVMGKLVPQDPSDEPVDNLLARILVERKQLKRGNSDDSQSPKPLGYDIPEHWKWQCLNSILVSGPTNGFSPQAVDYETPVRSLTLSATTSGKFKGEYSKFISNDIPSNSNLWLRDGDILVQRGNTLEYVGVPAVYRGEPNCFIYPDLMMKLRVSLEIDTSFIYLAMSSEPCRDFLRSHASGTSGTMPKINQATLKSLPIPIPPLAEQRRIVAKIAQLMALCDHLEQKINATTAKRSTLLNALLAQV
jgi:type I restriction enzyme, S subunit